MWIVTICPSWNFFFEYISKQYIDFANFIIEFKGMFLQIIVVNKVCKNNW